MKTNMKMKNSSTIFEYEIFKKDNHDFIKICTDNKKFVKLVRNELWCYADNYEQNPRYKSGEWDGKIKFYDFRVGEIDGKKFFCLEFSIGFKHVFEKYSGIKLSNKIDNTIPLKDYLKTEISKLPFTPRRYQLLAVKGLTQNDNHMAVSSVSSGKSVMIYLAMKYHFLHNRKILIVVPTIDLVNQIYNDFKDYGFEYLSQIKRIGGDHKDKRFNKRIVISTWQSLKNIPKNEFKVFDVAFIDEAHIAKADIVMEIFSMPFKHRYGLTGSFPIIDEDRLKLTYNFGEPRVYIKAIDLIKMGFATETIINTIFLKHCHTKLMGYYDEIDYIISEPERLKFLASFIYNLTFNSEKYKGVSIVLYHRTEYGKALWEKLTNDTLTTKKMTFKYMKKKNIFFISGKTKSSEREKILSYIKNYKGEAILVGQYQIMSTGINIPALKNLIFAQSFKSYVKVIQSIGRVLRKFKTKKVSYVFDIIDDTSGNSGRMAENYLLRHFWYRLKYYRSEGFEIREKEVNICKKDRTLF